jgi:anti-sigma factor RsiW
MSKEISDERLNDYVDGLLSAAETAEIEMHLAHSSEARDTVEFLRALRERSAGLPRSMEPERDLWPGIRESMAPAPLASVDGAAEMAGNRGHAPGHLTRPPARPARRAGWSGLDRYQWASLAAAAMVLVAVSSSITAWVVGVPGGGSSPMSPPAAVASATGVALSDMPAVPAAYVVEIEQLLWVLDENRDRLDPDTVTTIETNLRVIDRAIRSAREAIVDDPQNPGLTRMLTSNYRHKLQLLQRANRIIELS